MRIVLIGYRGTGKTTVSRLVAQRLNLDWWDADIELERRAGKSIKQIFADDGERVFRDLEVQTIAELVQRDQVVLAVGGGAVMRQENRLAITDATVVWLTASPESIHARITADAKSAGQRPNLTIAGGLAEITALLRERGPVYQDCADLVVDTEGKSAEQVAEEIVCLLNEEAAT